MGESFIFQKWCKFCLLSSGSSQKAERRQYDLKDTEMCNLPSCPPIPSTFPCSVWYALHCSSIWSLSSKTDHKLLLQKYQQGGVQWISKLTIWLLVSGLLLSWQGWCEWAILLLIIREGPLYNRNVGTLMHNQFLVAKVSRFTGLVTVLHHGTNVQRCSRHK